MEPTLIYSAALRRVLQHYKVKNVVHGVAHITGGGFEENVPRAIPEGLCAQINLSSWDIPGVFKWLQGKGNLSQADMTQTFNCGIGMVMIVDPQYADQIMQRLEHENETCFRMGSVISSVQGKKVDLLNTLPF
jgi:phosphoribosylformylglycinamidine cyclo-ligase